jgi:signal transduction histidine kinase
MGVPLIVNDAVAGAMTFVGRSMSRYVKENLEFAETLASRTALAVENAIVYQEARDALKAKDEFLTVLAHEIRGPITSIHLCVQAMTSSTATASDMPKMLAIIEREDRRLSGFVNELVDLRKIQSGQIQFALEEVALGDVVREAVDSLSTELAESRSALSITMEGRPVGQWDKYGLRQVVTNLLSNAIKFGDGKPLVVGFREDQGKTILQVTDHGIGIEAEKLDEIFNPFQRGVPVRNYGGLGLGLYIARTIVEGLGGNIRVQSKPKEGTTFTVELRNTGTL